MIELVALRQALIDQHAEKRCSGHCCKAFFLPYTPEQCKDDKVLVGICEEDRPLLESAVFIGREEIEVEGQISMTHWYTCRHLQSNGDCGIYKAPPASILAIAGM